MVEKGRERDEDGATLVRFTPTWIVAADCSLVISSPSISNATCVTSGKFLPSPIFHRPNPLPNALQALDQGISQDLKRKNEQQLFNVVRKVKEGAFCLNCFLRWYVICHSRCLN